MALRDARGVSAPSSRPSCALSSCVLSLFLYSLVHCRQCETRPVTLQQLREAVTVMRSIKLPEVVSREGDRMDATRGEDARRDRQLLVGTPPRPSSRHDTTQADKPLTSTGGRVGAKVRRLSAPRELQSSVLFTGYETVFRPHVGSTVGNVFVKGQRALTYS